MQQRSRESASRTIPDAYKVWTLASVGIPRVADAPSGAVESEYCASVGVLIGNQEPLATLVELEVPWRLAACVEYPRKPVQNTSSQSSEGTSSPALPPYKRFG